MGLPAAVIVEAGEQAAARTVTLTVIEGGLGAAGTEAAAGGAAAAGIGGAAIATAGVAVLVIGLGALAYYLYTRDKHATRPKPATPPNATQPCAPVIPAPAPIPTATPNTQTQPQTKPRRPNCDDILAELYEAMNEALRRIDELLEDKLDLYHRAYDIPNPALPPNSGTWVGHLQQAEGWQNRIYNLIDKAIANGCPVPPGAWKLATRPLPSQPRGN